jgi:hypothetical protein
MRETLEASAVVEPTEVEAIFDAVCHWYFGRELHEHTAVRRRMLGLLADAACVTWPWVCVQHHCGLSSAFLALVYQGLQHGAEAAIALAEQERDGPLGRETLGLVNDPRVVRVDAASGDVEEKTSDDPD